MCVWALGGYRRLFDTMVARIAFDETIHCISPSIQWWLVHKILQSLTATSSIRSDKDDGADDITHSGR